MVNKFIPVLLLVFFSIFPFALFSQNGYSVSVSQPDSVGPPVIYQVSTTTENINSISWIALANKSIFSLGIYRESVQYPNKWELLERISPQLTNEYLDKTSDPQRQSYRYRISAIDKCGLETPLSDAHRTIRLQVITLADNTSVLRWNPYEGKRIQSYTIYRGDNINQLQSIAQTNTTQYNDTARLMPDSQLYYRIKANLEDKIQENDKSTSYSNFSFVTYTNNTDSTSRTSLQIYPNPFAEHATIFFSNPSGKPYEIFIFDLIGNPVFSKKVNTSQIDIERNNLKEGMYLIKIKGEHIFEGKMSVYNPY